MSPFMTPKATEWHCCSRCLLCRCVLNSNELGNLVEPLAKSQSKRRFTFPTLIVPPLLVTHVDFLVAATQRRYVPAVPGTTVRPGLSTASIRSERYER